jgi:outer membrane lipoprotein-sorting protein
MAVLIVCTAAAQMPQPFSADMASSTRGTVNMKGKFFFSAPKIRMDITDAGQQQRQAGPFGGKMSVIMDGDSKMGYMLMPEAQMYMEFQADGNSPMTQRMPKLQEFKGDPCTGRRDATCKKVGTEAVNGRPCDKWEVTDKNGEKETLWIDQKLHFPIKSQTASGTAIEFSNVKEGAQDASLFKVPAGYRKFDMGAVGQRPH